MSDVSDDELLSLIKRTLQTQNHGYGVNLIRLRNLVLDLLTIPENRDKYPIRNSIRDRVNDLVRHGVNDGTFTASGGTISDSTNINMSERLPAHDIPMLKLFGPGLKNTIPISQLVRSYMEMENISPTEYGFDSVLKEIEDLSKSEIIKIANGAKVYVPSRIKDELLGYTVPSTSSSTVTGRMRSVRQPISNLATSEKISTMRRMREQPSTLPSGYEHE